MELNESLANLGFSVKEAKLYLAVLQHQQITPADLARVTKINRATVYHIAMGLVSRGVIAEELGGKKRMFVALPPTALEQTLEQQRRELTQQETMVKQTIGKLSVLTAKKEYPVPKVRFVPEEQLKKFLHQEAAVWSASVLKNDLQKTWWGFQDPSLVEHYEEWINWYWQTADKSIQLKMYSHDAPIEKKFVGKYAQRQLRSFGVQMDFSATTWVTGEYVIMIYTQQRPHYLVEIHDARFAENLREFFVRSWESNQVVAKKADIVKK